MKYPKSYLRGNNAAKFNILQGMMTSTIKALHQWNYYSAPGLWYWKQVVVKLSIKCLSSSWMWFQKNSGCKMKVCPIEYLVIIFLGIFYWTIVVNSWTTKFYRQLQDACTLYTTTSPFRYHIVVKGAIFIFVCAKLD